MVPGGSPRPLEVGIRGPSLLQSDVWFRGTKVTWPTRSKTQPQTLGLSTATQLLLKVEGVAFTGGNSVGHLHSVTGVWLSRLSAAEPLGSRPQGPWIPPVPIVQADALARPSLQQSALLAEEVRNAAKKR